MLMSRSLVAVYFEQRGCIIFRIGRKLFIIHAYGDNRVVGGVEIQIKKKRRIKSPPIIGNIIFHFPINTRIPFASLHMSHGTSFSVIAAWGIWGYALIPGGVCHKCPDIHHMPGDKGK